MWAFDVTYMLYGTHFMLGTAYTLMRVGHVRTDMLYQNWSIRRQNLVDAIGYLFFFFPGWPCYSTSAGRRPLTHGRSAKPQMRVPGAVVYPFKTVIPLTALLLLVQGVAEFLGTSTPFGRDACGPSGRLSRYESRAAGGIMLVVMLGAIFIGFPIAFTLILLALIFGWVGLGDIAFTLWCSRRSGS